MPIIIYPNNVKWQQSCAVQLKNNTGWLDGKLKDWYQFMAKFMLIIWQYYYYYICLPLLLQTIVIKVWLWCEKIGNFDTNTHKPELYLLSLATFLKFYTK